MKKYALVVAYRVSDFISFDRGFTKAKNHSDAYFSPEMKALEDNLLSKGISLENNFAFEIPEEVTP